jgi:hypothetical protein
MDELELIEKAGNFGRIFKKYSLIIPLLFLF